MRRILDLYSPAHEVRNQIESGPCLAPFLLDILWQIDGEGMKAFVYHHLYPFDPLSELCRKAVYRHMDATGESVAVEIESLPSALFEVDGV